MKNEFPDIRSVGEFAFAINDKGTSKSISQPHSRLRISCNAHKGSPELLNQEISQEYFNSGKICKSGDFQNDKMAEENNQDQFIEEKFMLTSPQIPYYDTISSSKSLLTQRRPENSISEMMSEKELNIYGITDNKYNSENFNKTRKGYIPDFYKHTQLSSNEDYQSLKCPSEENLFSPDHFYEPIKITSNLSNNIKPQCLGSDLSLSSLIMNGSSDGTLDSEDDSNTSSEFSSIEESLFGQKYLLTTNTSMPISSKLDNNKLVKVTDSIVDLDEIDRELSMIDKEIKSFSQTKFDVSDLSVGSEMESRMAEKFKNLQKDISRFLERTAIFEDMGNDLLNFDSDQNEAEHFLSSSRPPNQIEILSSSQPSTNENSNHSLAFQFPNIIDRNTFPNELFAHSSDLFTSFGGNPNSEHDQANLNGKEQKSDFLNEFKNSAITFNEEATMQGNLMIAQDFRDFSEIINPSSYTGSVETLHKLEGKETIFRDDNIEDEIFLTAKYQNNEESTELEDYKRYSDLNVDKKATQLKNKNYFTDYNSTIIQDFIFGKGNRQEGIEFLEDEVTDGKNDSIKSQMELL